jgi:uncharacterized membrane protein
VRQRFWEIDFARTVAIAMMVTYHTGYDIDFLAPDVGLQPLEGGWRALQVATGSLFLFVSGLSFTISDASARRRGLVGRAWYAKHARRGAQVIGFGLVISLVTWIALDDRYVRFGILHAIGASILLAPLVVRLGVWNAPLGIAVILGGLALRDTQSDIPGLLLVGVAPTGTAGVDYYPLLPWFGLFALGIAAGVALYPHGRPGRWVSRLPSGPPRWLTAPGRHSLAIYLVHQPILIATIAGILAVLGVEWAWSP